MPKTIEQGSNKLFTFLGNATALPTEWIKPLFALHLGYKEIVMSNPISEQPQFDIGWGYPRFTPDTRWSLGRITIGMKDTCAVFYNAVFFLRIMFPFWIGIQIRWAGIDPTAKEYLQVGLGWANNGRLKALFRVQSDVSSAAGTTGPNIGQSVGWFDGGK